MILVRAARAKNTRNVTAPTREIEAAKQRGKDKGRKKIPQGLKPNLVERLMSELKL
jgi:hypothetical protein